MEKTLTVDDKTARQIYPNAAPEFKALLERAFTKDFFSGKITDRIKTFEDACEAMGISADADDFEEGTDDEIAYKKLKVVVLALNEGWTPDWNNSGQYKWAPWFYLDKPGFRFCASYCSGTGAYTAGGSRLCFKSDELATYAGKQFLDLYKAWLS